MSSFGKKMSKTKLPNTEKIYNGLVRLPLYPSLQKFEINNISKSVESFLKKKLRLIEFKLKIFVKKVR